MTASRHVTSSLRLVNSGAALLLSSAAFFVSSPARAIVAPACDPGCMAGYHCEAQTVTTCPDIACAPGTNCGAMCTSTFSYGCVPNPCMDDRDCSENTVCVSETSGCTTQPTTPACPPGSDCKALPAPDPIPCDPIVTRSCKPRYELPCNTAADCGGGFTCVPESSCGCSGGTPSSGDSADPAPSGAAAPLPPGAGGGVGGVGAGGGTSLLPPPDCSCTPSGVSRCQLTLQACNFNSDCPAGLVCKSTSAPTRDAPSDSASGQAPAMGGASGIGGAGTAGLAGSPNPGGAAEQPAPGPIPQPVELFCVPPNWSYPTPIGVGGGTGVGGETGLPRPTPGGGPSTGTGGNTGIGGSTGVAGGTGAVPPTATKGPGTNSGDRVEGGCQVGAGGPASSGFGILTALGLAGLLRRRARRAV